MVIETMVIINSARACSLRGTLKASLDKVAS